MTASWDRLLQGAGSCAHALEFHRPGERGIGRSAGRFLAGALRAHGAALAIATARTGSDILAELTRLGVDTLAAIEEQRLVVLDSADTVSRFTRDNVVDAAQFASTVGQTVRAAHQRAAGAPLRAYGDMVGVLWLRRERDAAIELERLWNALQRELGFALFCGYPIDVFGPDFCGDEIAQVLEEHTHMMPGTATADLAHALDRAMDDVLGAQAGEVRSRIGARNVQRGATMPRPEHVVLWLRAHEPQIATPVLDRARSLYDAAAPRVYLR